ncbi:MULTISPECIES: beta-lactamase hydrolase domain-containing protein [Rhizobium]|uniref:Sulfur transferase domain-containing protein n=1 Tax=Rhizobium rhododendri TaxID=2506430 RepID=A0ABY8IE16_9HYPH|nr:MULTISPECIES: sulfur transferase domain-containing protein [Rhizobium]MBO9098918.1 TIGR01244 family phosphatase [Rhizobium sp. L58/93]MBO9132277.1 TIGR01244 family phosphatase [Rhizobium sp. B209b/85]MBO9169182.1 TIGR01244 family phosphatase [Rhizobium sp. L245/93]MBO9185133.1 TIGR01244 family phosphatase [Rhizobium sp. E27B/91]MBZ5758552.1 TIGR01244 family phosphatase [Rhizobium sp. VS19-DR96]
MDIRKIDDQYSVTGQISVDDLDEIKAMGFESIVCHRPDHESPDQPLFDDIATRAEELGFIVAHVPVGPMGVTEEAVSSMMDALDEFPRPMLGYCRSGARSTAIYEKTKHMRM